MNAYKDRAIPIIKDLRDLLEQVAYELNIPYSKPDLPLRWWQQIWAPGHLHKWATILTGDDLVRSSIIASLFYHLEDFEASIYSWQEFARLAEKKADDPSLALAYNNIGVAYRHKEQWDEAIKYYKKGLEFSERSGDIKTMAKVYANLEVVYGNKGERDKAIECFRKNVELSQRLEDIEYKDVFLGAAFYKK